MALQRPAEYLVRFDGHALPSQITAWVLQSPDTTNWTGSITTAGVISLTSGGAAGTAPTVPTVDAIKYDPSVSNGGILTLTSAGALTSADQAMAFLDADSVVWTMFVDDDGQSKVTTADLTPFEFRYPSFVFSYAPVSNTDTFQLSAVRLDVTVKRLAS